MGIGLILVIGATDVDEVQAALLNAGEANAMLIGAIEAGSGEVRYV
jgi:phosphoribosylaminoimidazole (AIR) synthetase